MCIRDRLTLIAAACAPAPTAATVFSSDALGSIRINVTVPGDPDADPPTQDQTLPVDIPLTGVASGTWDTGDTGQFDVDLALDSGSFPLDVPGIGTLTITYSINDVATGSGSFDPQTGIGGFGTSIVFTVDEVDALGPISQPCDLEFGMSLGGQIDPDTGMLDVGRDGFGAVSYTHLFPSTSLSPARQPALGTKRTQAFSTWNLLSTAVRSRWRSRASEP